MIDLQFENVKIRNCPFELSISDMTSGLSSPIDASIFTYTEPVQTVKLSDYQKVSIDSWGSLKLHIPDHNDNSKNGSYNLRLKTMAQRYVGET